MDATDFRQNYGSTDFSLAFRYTIPPVVYPIKPAAPEAKYGGIMPGPAPAPGRVLTYPNRNAMTSLTGGGILLTVAGLLALWWVLR